MTSQSPGDVGPTVVDPGTRGLTRIAPNVVERVAAFACRDADGVLSARSAPSASKMPPIRARADVMGSHVHLSVRVPVVYPRRIIEVSASVRAEISRAVQHLCGLHVDGVDVEAVPVNQTRVTRVQ
ncbi:putative alkaline shock family protein YloU [Antricoccus suffuscus]|uniref:Putative alkaline shock family protein YloU n=1 Tax=Antricoccus suffuscus TaxID=1629062 RepID=A0A2T1A519_9ACTN|nr:Asp23/Gls24 family envelope stress response protein [Antricoccus suffuscus]PRZ43701.1 putative alkaline shock family protein YloU [Antricoccus suffuscus]